MTQPGVLLYDAGMGTGLPTYGINEDYPLLWERAQQHDFAERLSGSTDALAAEIDAALRELWDARRTVEQFS